LNHEDVPVPVVSQQNQLIYTEPSSNLPPLVQVGLPVFNGEAELAKTIDSLLSQDYPNLEILISDNCSTDNTGAIGRAYAASNAKIKYWCNDKNIGSIPNFELLFSKCQGKYFFWCGHNDIFSPQFVSKAVTALESDQGLAHCFPHGIMVNEDGSRFNYPHSFIDTRGMSKECRFLIAIWHLGPCTEFYGIYRTSVLKQVMPFKRVLPIDYMLLTEIATLGPSRYIWEEQMRFRVNVGSILQTARRHGFNPNKDFGKAQYHAFCRETVAIALRRFSFFSLIKILPSLSLCLIEKFIFIRRDFDIVYQKEQMKTRVGK